MKTHQTNKTPAQTSPKDLQAHLKQQPETAQFGKMLRQVLTNKADIGEKRAQIDTLLAQIQTEPNEPRKVALLEASLQAGVSDVGGNSHPDNSHKVLVSKTLQQIASLPTTPTRQNPIDKLDLSQTSNDMFEHLTFARRFITLYPPGGAASTQPESPQLHSALHAHFDNPCPQTRKNAEQALRDETVAIGYTGDAEPDSFDMWKTAQEKNNLDIRRAVLLLHPDEIDFVGAKTRKETPDPALKKVLKEIPYQSRRCRNVSTQDFNCKTTFKSYPDEPIICMHLATHRIETQAGHVKNKFRVMHNEQLENHFPSMDAIREHVHPHAEEQYYRIRDMAIETHLIPHADFGKTLIAQFKVMTAKNESARHILLLSTSHVMSLQLHMKTGKRDDKQYVVEFYDPSVTTDHVRISNTELNALHNLSLMDLFKQPEYKGLYNEHFSDNDNLITLHVVGNPAQTLKIINHDEAPQLGAVKNRKLTIDIERTQVTGRVLGQLLLGGFGGTLRDLTPDIKKTMARMSNRERVRLLAAVDKREFPGLYCALQEGHADAIRAFAPLLELLPNSVDRISVLAAMDGHGSTGLHMALINGHSEAIKAFGELLAKVPENERAHLLAARDTQGVPGLYHALRDTHTECITAFGELLGMVPDEQDRIDLLAAREPDGTPALYWALCEGQTEAIIAFGELLEKVPDKQGRMMLLAAGRSGGTPGLYSAMELGHTEASKALLNLMTRFL